MAHPLGRVAHGCMLFMLTALCTGCHRDHIQSALHPAGPQAREIATLWWAMFAVLAMVFLGTMLLLVMAITSERRQRKAAAKAVGSRPSAVGKGQADSRQPTADSPKPPAPPMGDVKFVTVTGIIVPAVILVALLIMSLRSTIALRTPPSNMTIAVTAHQFWWHIEYPDYGIITANEFYIPVGKPVVLELRSADVAHSLWVPNLMSKMDMLPERVNEFWIQADRPGRWRGQCAEFCGIQHALMGLWIVALEQDEFDQWVQARLSAIGHWPSAKALPTADSREPRALTEIQRRGKEIFFSELAGCHACHAIGGTDAVAVLGPDLTHIASRLSLGAATIPNRRELLKRWIRDPHQFKPGNLMPPTDLPAEDLDALVEYLMSLE